MGEKTPSRRRSVLKMAGSAVIGLALSGTAQAKNDPSTEEFTGGGGDGYPYYYKSSDSFIGPDYHGHETRLELGSGLVEYEPRYSNASDKWELDFVVSGESDLRHTSDDSPSDWMWQQEHKIHVDDSSTDLYSRNDPDWLGGTGRGSGGYDYVSDEQVADGIGEALAALNPVPGGDYVVEQFASEMANWALSQDNDTQLKRVWNFQKYNTYEHTSGTHLLFRIEVNGGYSDDLTVQNTAIATRESVAINKFKLSFNTEPEPNSFSTAEMQELGLKLVTPAMITNASPNEIGISSHTAKEVFKRDEPMYVATDANFTSVTSISGGNRTEEYQRLTEN